MNLRDCLKNKGIALPAAQIGVLEHFAELFLSKNKNLNLSSIRDRKEFYLKHIADSLLALPYLKIQPCQTLLDVGTGGGVPGIPLAIVFPDAQVTLLDATGKKVKAVQTFIHELQLTNAIALQGRAEELACDANYRERFDWVVARAVAPLRTLAEYCLPFAKIGGHFLAYKGNSPEAELRQAEQGTEALGGQIVEVFQKTVPDLGERSFILIKKIKKTSSAYPRNAGHIKKNPL